MSQRLTLSAIHNDKVLVAAQWAWGAYTKAATGILDDFLFNLSGVKMSKKDENLNTYRLLRVFEEMGGSFMDDGRKVKNRLDALGDRHGRGHRFVTTKTRDGEFQYTFNPSGWFETFLSDSNGRMTVDLSAKTIIFDVYNSYADEDWKKYKYDKYYTREIKPPVDIHDMSFDDFVAFREFVRDKWNAVTDFVSKDGWRYSAIC